jgi:hypothetical protein
MYQYLCHKKLLYVVAVEVMNREQYGKKWSILSVQCFSVLSLDLPGMTKEKHDISFDSRYLEDLKLLSSECKSDVLNLFKFCNHIQ